ncbi:hypothetical protein V499_03849 [Pseudogymnoascus sp. VKM F-103]|nr:hypothetical protein V499_03849 [Pseudogymnoascus sp. VKM F-103]
MEIHDPFSGPLSAAVVQAQASPRRPQVGAALIYGSARLESDRAVYGIVSELHSIGITTLRRISLSRL